MRKCSPKIEFAHPRGTRASACVHHGCTRVHVGHTRGKEIGFGLFWRVWDNLGSKMGQMCVQIKTPNVLFPIQPASLKYSKQLESYGQNRVGRLKTGPFRKGNGSVGLLVGLRGL